MSRILLITSSPRGADSLSTRFASDLAHRLSEKHPDSTLTVRDLYAHPLAHINEAYVIGRTLSRETRTPEQSEAVGLAETLVAELNAADIILIGSGMINFGPPTQLKAWFDYVTWAGVTFKYIDNSVVGLVTGKKVYLVTAAGGVYSEGPFASFDHQSGYLKHLLAFIGLTDVEHLHLEGIAYGADAVNAAIAKAETAIKALTF